MKERAIEPQFPCNCPNCQSSGQVECWFAQQVLFLKAQNKTIAEMIRELPLLKQQAINNNCPYVSDINPRSMGIFDA